MDIMERITAIICEQFDVDPESVSEDTNLAEDLDADSLDLVDLVMTLEDEFGTEVPDEDLADLKTIGDVVKFVEERI